MAAAALLPSANRLLVRTHRAEFPVALKSLGTGPSRVLRIPTKTLREHHYNRLAFLGPGWGKTLQTPHDARTYSLDPRF